jgi:hypothetical protein
MTSINIGGWAEKRLERAIHKICRPLTVARWLLTAYLGCSPS